MQRREGRHAGAGPGVRHQRLQAVEAGNRAEQRNGRPQVTKLKVLGNQRVAQGGELKRAKRRMTSVKKNVAD